MTNRRDFIKKATLTGLAASLAPTVVSANTLDRPINRNKKRALRIAHVTDVHILNDPTAEVCYARVLRAINSLKDKPAFILNTGDTVMDENNETEETVAARWGVWNKIFEGENKLPLYSALGNHDVWYGPDEKLDALYKKDPRYGKQWAMNVLKMPGRYYSFEKNGWKFIALDSINGTSGYQLDDEQFNWLSAELQKSKVPVCIFNHVPILSMGALLYFTKRKPLNEITFPSGDMHNDHQRLKDLFFQNPNVKVCLSGHVHYVDGIEYLGVKYLCNGAVSGNWWRNPLTLDEFPPAYAILDLYEDGTSDSRLVYYDFNL